ncbi:hypothetical protein J2S43_004639 [Catenuloplanes nepalensis]|uniref:Uncharacterized protein n=1 Tax=Catenuloplanes nepalensis TaxID=587533 RepID=A0ABT9MXF6_9ACTN|nr:hypothetical protein [Catenuloplanes nepalensis]MDP9796127.1 hypothetical protein [Catenuloplanes nepalensis]
MTLPLTQRVMDAICLDHIVPTPTGLHLRRDGMAALLDDQLLTEALDLTAPDGYAYVTLGKGMEDTFADVRDATTAWADGVRTAGAAGTHAQRVARNLFYQFINGHPGTALDRMVERLIGETGLSPAELIARADASGLPVDSIGRDLPPDLVDQQRLIGFSRDMRIVPVEEAYLIRVVPSRHWAGPDPFAGESAESLARVLSAAYPSARLVFLPDGTMRAGLPETLADHLYGDALRSFGRALDAQDFPETFQTLQRYGDLLAAMAATPVGTEPGSRAGTQALIRIGDQVTLANHDAHGISFLNLGPDLAGGVTTPFAARPGAIDVAVLDGLMTLPERLLDLNLTQPAPAPAHPLLPIRHAGPITLHRDLGNGHTLDRIGAVPEPVMSRVEKALAGVGQSGIVLRPGTLTGAELAALDQQLFQHLYNGGRPIVVTLGKVDDELRQLAERRETPVLHQTAGTGMFSLDNMWAAVGGSVAVQPAKEITADVLQPYAGRRMSERPRPPEKVAEYLSTPLEDVQAIRTLLRQDGGTLRTLLPQIDEQGARPQTFAAHAALLRVFDEDPAFAERLLEYRVGGVNNADRLFAAAADKMTLAPEARDEAFADIEAITLGVLDDGASRGILRGIQMLAQGHGYERAKQEIFKHRSYLPDDGRAKWVRLAATLRPVMLSKYGHVPNFLDDFDRTVVYVQEC